MRGNLELSVFWWNDGEPELVCTFGAIFVVLDSRLLYVSAKLGLVDLKVS